MKMLVGKKYFISHGKSYSLHIEIGPLFKLQQQAVCVIIKRRKTTIKQGYYFGF